MTDLQNVPGTNTILPSPAVFLHRERINTALCWDLGDVGRFMIVRQRANGDHVGRIAREYRRFLGIIAAYPNDRFPISEPVDAMWHVHILFTRDYTRMSLAVRGEYINHDPVLSEAQRAALEPFYIGGTIARYREIYGEEPPIDLWPLEGGAICWSGYDVNLQ